MSRWKAAAIHLSISATIGLVAAALIFGVWYPPPYSRAAGAGELVLLLLGVDVVLGPLLTLAVFKSGKKSLKFDLSVIAMMQACAFIYGMSVVVEARPAFIVGAVDRFTLISANDLDPADLAEGKLPQFRSLPWTGPLLVAAQRPDDVASRNALLLSGIAGKDIDKFPKYYADYAAHPLELLSRAHSLDALRGKHPDAAPLIDAWLQRHKRDAESVAWVPLTSRRANLTMLLDRKTGAPLDVLMIDPW